MANKYIKKGSVSYNLHERHVKTTLQNWEQNNVVLAYNPRYKVNIHVFILIQINDWINKGGNGGSEEQIFLTEEFQIIYTHTPSPLSINWGW